jgi:hypothetical protein
VDDSSIAGNFTSPRMVGVALADGLTTFLGYFKSGGAGTTPRAQSSLFGANRPIIFDSTLNKHFIDSTNSTAALVSAKIIGFPPNVLGDSGGVPCYLKFLSSNVSAAINIGGQAVA